MGAQQRASEASASARRLIWATALLGLAAIPAAVAADGWWPEEPAAALILSGIALLSVVIPVRYTHPDGDVQGFNFTHAVIVALLFVAPSGLAVVAAAASAVVGFGILASGLPKILFNAGHNALSAGAAAAVFHAASSSADTFSAASVVAALLALLAAELVSAALMGELFHRLDGRERGHVLRASQQLLGLAVVGNALGAVLLVFLALEAPEATVLGAGLAIGALEVLLRVLPLDAGITSSQFGRP